MNNIRLNQYFNLREFQCPCCHRVMLHKKLYQLLTKLRYEIGKPILINSGYRCPKYNLQVKGSPGSYHMLGMAADITIKDVSLYELFIIASELDFTGIGYYENKNFLHLDVRPGARVEWKE